MNEKDNSAATRLLEPSGVRVISSKDEITEKKRPRKSCFGREESKHRKEGQARGPESESKNHEGTSFNLDWKWYLVKHHLSGKSRNLKYFMSTAFVFERPTPICPAYRPGFGFLGPLKPSIPIRIGRKFIPKLRKVRNDVSYWRTSFPELDRSVVDLWINQSDLKAEALEDHVSCVREDAWQVSQEYSIARWWFLTPRLPKSPYYSEVLNLARTGATIVDLGCGLGQELRWLHADGATGNLFAIDNIPELWTLGNRLFKDSADSATFCQVCFTYHSTSNPNPLGDFGLERTVFLLNDVLSFMGHAELDNTLRALSEASQIGTKVVGWVIGQEGEDPSDQRVHGGGMRGVIHNLASFQQQLSILQTAKQSEWHYDSQLVDFEQIGFDAEDCKWFKSSYFHGGLMGEPMSLRAICFLATRLQ